MLIATNDRHSISQIQDRIKRSLICYLSGSRCVIDESDTMPFVDLLHRCTSSNQSGPMGLFRKRDFLPVHRPARCA